MLYLILFVSFIVFLFCLYKLGRDDYVFIRKNITLVQLFDIGFLMWIGGLMLSKILISFFHPAIRNNYLNLSVIDGVIGGIVFIYLSVKYSKLPLGRIFDFCAVSFLTALPVIYFGSLFFIDKKERMLSIFSGVLYLVLAVFFLKVIYPRLTKGAMREGSLSILFLITFSITSLLISILSPVKGIYLFLKPEDFLLIGIFIINLLLLIRQERKSIQKFRTRIKTNV